MNKKYDFHITLYGSEGKKLKKELLKIKTLQNISFSEWIKNACFEKINNDKNIKNIKNSKNSI